MDDDETGLYDKYRVIKTEDLSEMARLAERLSNIDDPETKMDSIAAAAIVRWVEGHSLSGSVHDENLGSLVFVLRPDHDYHARVALYAYAASVQSYNDDLAMDLFGALDLMNVPTKMEPD